DAQMAAGQSFFNQHAFVQPPALIKHGLFSAVIQVIGHHDKVRVLRGEQAALKGLGGHAKGSQPAGPLELIQYGEDLITFNDRAVIAVRVYQHHIDIVTAQATQTAFNTLPHMGRGEVKTGDTVDKLFANLGADYPVMAGGSQQLAQALLAGAVSRCGVQQVYAQGAGLIQQLQGLRIRGQSKFCGVFDLLVAPQLDGPQTDGADGEVGLAESFRCQHENLPPRSGRHPAGVGRQYPRVSGQLADG